MDGASQPMARSKSTSIWAEGLPSPRTSGWISPALGTARSISSMGTHNRPRGLQVAVLNAEKQELILGDVPHHPGTSSTPGLRPESVGMERGKAKLMDTGAQAQRRESESASLPLCRAR